MGNRDGQPSYFPYGFLFKPRLNLTIDGYIDVIKLLSTNNYIKIQQNSFIPVEALIVFVIWLFTNQLGLFWGENHRCNVYRTVFI